MMRSNEIAQGLHALMSDTKLHADIPLQKLSAMQDIYFDRNPGVHSRKEVDGLHYYLQAVSYKFHLTILHLEQIWALSEEKRLQAPYVLANSFDRLETSDSELLAISFAFEGFLLQSRTFLDFYMIYVCRFVKSGFNGSMTFERFFKNLSRARNGPCGEAAKLIGEYFNENVFSQSEGKSLAETEWGTLLISLRDKIAHRDRLHPSFNSRETLTDGILFDWPTLRDTTYDRLCQYFHNGMFALLRETSPILYGLEWKSGPLKSDMWQTTA